MKSSDEVIIGKKIGEGSLSTVYHADARYMCTSVAVKCITNASPQLQAALKKEAFIVMPVNSPFIVDPVSVVSCTCKAS